jgi:hypothetical protein
VDGAEIYVDGDFVGNTPSALSLNAGAHRVEVKAANGASWQRDFHVLNDSEITIKATLAQDQKTK